MNKTVKLMGTLAIMAGMTVASAAYAQTTDIWSSAGTKLLNVFNNVRQIVFIMGGFALVGCAVAAIFGKLEWKKVGILAVGLALLAVAGQVVDYAVHPDAEGGNVDFSSSSLDYDG